MLVVGIPAHNEEHTVAAVAIAADQGIRDAFPGEDAVIMLAENASTDATVERFRAAPVQTPTVVASTNANTGKGTNLLTIVAHALEIGADTVVLLDADVRSVEPWWVGALGQGVRKSETPAIAVPIYKRNRFESNTTNHLATPMLAAVFGRLIRQPIGGEFALNRQFMQCMEQWKRPDSALLYGVDVWLTGNGLREDALITEVALGRKVHTPPFKKVLRMPQQVTDALLHVVTTVDTPKPLANIADGIGVDDAPGERPPVDLIKQITSQVSAYVEQHGDEIGQLFPSVRSVPAAPWGSRLDTEVWPLILADALTALPDGWPLPLVRDHLMALNVQRIYSWWDEIEELTSAQAQALVDRQVRATAAEVQRRGLFWSGVYAPRTFNRGLWTHQGDQL